MMNVGEVCKHIQSYFDVYEFIEQDEKPIQEVKQYLMEVCHKPESTARSHIEAIKKSDAGLLQIKGDLIGLDLGKAMEFERALDGIFHWQEYDDRSSDIYHWKRAFNKANETIEEANRRIKEIDDLCMEEIKKHEKDVKQLEQKLAKARLTNQALEEKLLVEKTSHNVVDSASVQIKDSRNSWSNKSILFSEAHPSLDPEKCSLNSYFESLKKENKLTAAKLKAIAIGRIFSDRILGKVVEHMKPLHKLRRRIYPNQGIFTIEELLSYDGLTNSEKLALYAFSTKHFSKEKMELLEMASKYGINAEYVIRIFESYIVSKKTKDAFMDALRLATAESEYAVRMQFAKELLWNQWCIEAEYSGKKTEFQLVPVQELVQVKLELSDLAFRVQYNRD